ncbi:hypothetical protein H4P12_16605 [Paracoccus sp. 11-3]|uniref:Uncharacterized protein n=1 Tax=Paracoccus amoyensis TaxID=2760093 RepID=A0A926GJY3_9RHOB|nr:hypothetical protein [Paracoccus amoyensis]MBC9248292.1 hypothetical protein [Paracoccus amoyensis]
MDWKKIGKILDLVASEVKRQDGTVWKASASELQSQYNEMPFWILLYEDSDLQNVHRVFQKIVRPHFSEIKPVKITVAYLMMVDGQKIQTDYLEGEGEIMNDQHLMGRRPTSMGMGDFIVFKGMNSTRS